MKLNLELKRSYFVNGNKTQCKQETGFAANPLIIKRRPDLLVYDTL